MKDRDPQAIFKALNDSSDVTDDTQYADDVDDVVIVREVVEALDDAGRAAKRKTPAKVKVVEGKKVKLSQEQVTEKKKARGGLTPAQYRARVISLKKARLKAHTPAAETKRAKSNAKRRGFGLDSQALENLVETASAKIYEALQSAYDMDEVLCDSAEQALANFDIEQDDNVLIVHYPVFVKQDDSIDMSTFEMRQKVFEIEEGATEEDFIASLLDHADGIVSEMF